MKEMSGSGTEKITGCLRKSLSPPTLEKQNSRLFILLSAVAVARRHVFLNWQGVNGIWTKSTSNTGQLHRKCFTDRTKNTDVQTLAGWMTGRGEAFTGHLWRIIFAVLVFLRSWKSLYVVCLICGTQDIATESKDFRYLGDGCLWNAWYVSMRTWIWVPRTHVKSQVWWVPL